MIQEWFFTGLEIDVTTFDQKIINYCQVSLMAGHRCPIIHQFSCKACVVNVEKGQLKAIKGALRLSRRIVHAQMFEVGLFLFLITYNHKTNRQGGSDLFRPAIRFKC